MSHAGSTAQSALPQYDGNAYYSNTSGNRNKLDDTAGVNSTAPYTNVFDVILTVSPFTNAAGGDFSLNNTAGGGAACTGRCGGDDEGMMPIVYEQAVIQGTAISRSLVFEIPDTRDFVGTLFGDVDAAWQQISLQASVTPGEWGTVAVKEWKPGREAKVTWSGLARQVRMLVDMKHPASVGMRIETP